MLESYTRLKDIKLDKNVIGKKTSIIIKRPSFLCKENTFCFSFSSCLMRGSGVRRRRLELSLDNLWLILILRRRSDFYIKFRSRVNPAKLWFLCFFLFLLLSLAILKYRQYFLMLQALKHNNKKQKKNICFAKKKVW